MQRRARRSTHGTSANAPSVAISAGARAERRPRSRAHPPGPHSAAQAPAARPRLLPTRRPTRSRPGTPR
eukprot:2986893-Alexandrium_andersonii.AAC.1